MEYKEIQSRVDHYRKKTEQIIKGTVNNVPFNNFKSLNKVIPGIVPRIMYKVTSHSGMGKTQFSKAAFVYDPVDYCLSKNIAYTVFYVALEESADEFIDSYLIYLVFKTKKMVINRFKLEGYSTEPLTQIELDAIEDTKDLLAQHLSRVEIIDNKYKPTDIFNEIKIRATKYGQFKDYRSKSGEDVEGFFPTIKYHRFLVVCDHISLIEEEYDVDSATTLNQSKSIAKWHTRYARKIITKQWGWSSLNIQQQSLESEKQQFTSKGDSILEKVLPTLDGVANNKEVIRDDYVVIGIFSPERYGFKEYRGYKITTDPNNPNILDDAFYDNFRSIHILKNRFGTPNRVIPYYFMGRVNLFSELPLPMVGNELKLKPYYDNSLKIRNEDFARKSNDDNNT